jgi:uncharacterized membrane protein
MGTLSAICLAIHIYLSNMTGRTYYDFLLWNLFLAWLPYLISMGAYELNQRMALKGSAVFLVLLGVLWLLLFPNAPYLMTDLIHLTVLKNTYQSQGIYAFRYWYDFVMILLFAWNGLLLGFISTYQFHTIVRKYVKRPYSWLFIVFSSLLGGYGILLGREYRLNSWDVLTDMTSIRHLAAESLTIQTLPFCLLFSLLIAVIYATFYLVINHFTSPNAQ